MDSIGRLAPPPQIDLEDARIVLDLLDRPLAENGPLVEHRHLARDLPDELHVVLDDEHRAVNRDRLEQLAGPGSLLVGHPGDRLLDQEQLRARGGHPAAFAPPALAPGRPPRRPKAARGPRRPPCRSRATASRRAPRSRPAHPPWPPAGPS